jgi:predicted phosphodiesterase
MDGLHGIAGDLALLEPGEVDRATPIKSTRQPKRKTRAKRKIRPFSFAVISDTHLKKDCSAGLGKWVELAVDIINSRRPDFVVGLGDLVAGGGDCRLAKRGRGRADLAAQLQELKEKLLKKLKVPFVPVAGNHDLNRKNSANSKAPRRIWSRYWKENRKFVLRRAARHAHRTSYRFVHKGVAFSVVGYYDNDGLTRQEMRWVRRYMRTGDLVFRHINPFAVSTSGGREDGGFAIRSEGLRRYEQLTETLKKKKIRVLFSGHTHAFYDGVCDGLRFVNTGSLADRGMEYVKGWRNSPFKYIQAFVWVDVGPGGTVKTTFYFYEEKCGCFKVFNKSHFPAKVVSERMHRRDFDEGVAATCTTVGRGKGKPGEAGSPGPSG